MKENLSKGLIYCYQHMPTGERYIGQTTNFKKRQREHLNDARINLRFHNLLKKHPEDFQISILEDNIEKSELDEKEKYWIKFYDTFNGLGFNLTPGGDGNFEYCQKYWREHPKEKAENIKKSQPLAAQAAKEWRKNNPERSQELLDNLHKKTAEWRKLHPEEFEKNRLKAVESVSKKVICENTGIVYNSIQEASRATGACGSCIGACCNKKRKSAGKDKNNNKLFWRFYDE